MTTPQDLDADPNLELSPAQSRQVEDFADQLAGAPPPRWEPDNQMVAAVLASPKAWRGMTQLCDWDRAWLVAGLTLANMTAWEIAERLGCSLRLVRSIRAEDRTQACVAAQRDNHELTDDLRTERGEHALTRRDLAEALTREARLQTKLDQIVDRLTTTGKVDTFPRCVHPLVPYNTYEHKGQKRCRECRREWQANLRNSQKSEIGARPAV